MKKWSCANCDEHGPVIDTVGDAELLVDGHVVIVHNFPAHHCQNCGHTTGSLQVMATGEKKLAGSSIQELTYEELEAYQPPMSA